MARLVLLLPAIVLATALLVYAGASLALWHLQTRMMFPAPAAPLPVPSGLAEAQGYAMETVRTPDGLRLSFWAAPPRRNKPTLLFFHGNGAAAPSIVPTFSPLRQAGYGIVLAEYRGYSADPGTPSERAFAADARAYLTWTTARFGPDLPVVMGESIGTGVAVELAAEHPVRGVVLDAPFTSIAAVVRAGPLWWAPTFLLRSRFDSLSRIGHVAAPVLLIHGEADGLVPSRQSRILARAVPCLWKALYLPGVGHPALRNDGSGRAVTALLAFMDASRGRTCER